jgi:DNA-binding IscR family transcriptional regulator
MSTNQKVLAALKKAGKPLKSAEIAEAAGIDKKEADKAIKELKKDGSVVSPKNCFYALP